MLNCLEFDLIYRRNIRRYFGLNICNGYGIFGIVIVYIKIGICGLLFFFKLLRRVKIYML